MIRRSRFITTLGPAGSPEGAQDFIAGVREEFSDATHNCWAYVAGPPGSTTHVGMSDDGEPQGTAGRPMLTALLHGDVGEIAAVVTRYYGGVKLGTGGLGRAYSSGVQRALETLPRSEKVFRRGLHLVVDYPVVDAVLRLLDQFEARRLGEQFGARVQLHVEIPLDRISAFERAFADATQGTGEWSAVDAETRGHERGETE